MWTPRQRRLLYASRWTRARHEWCSPGDIDLLAVPELFERIQDADRADRGGVIVVMDDVRLIDSAGLGVLARLAGAGVNLELRGATSVTRRALEISGLDGAANIRVV